MKNLTLEQIQEKIGGKIWEKGELKRLYLDRGYNTKKMSTKTYVEDTENGYVVKCFIECPSQDWNWIKSQQAKVIENVESEIEEAFNPSIEEEFETIEDVSILDKIVLNNEAIVSYSEIGDVIYFNIKEDLLKKYSQKLFATPFQKVSYSAKIKVSEIKNANLAINNHMALLNENVSKVENFIKECTDLTNRGFKICGDALTHGQAQVMKDGQNVGHIVGMQIRMAQ